jgi:hypothetical protein
MNSLMVIFPYKINGVWAFDDERAGLVREPFVGAVNAFIDKMAEKVPDAESGIRLFFSARPFPGYTLSFVLLREEFEGNWYACNELGGQQGWLCPAMFKYFDVAPSELYAKAEPVQCGAGKASAAQFPTLKL